MKTTNKAQLGKRLVTALVVIVVIAVLLLSMHMLVNSLDFTGLIRSIHGG